MRINRDALLKLAKDNVEKKFAHDPCITAVFLVGSLRPENAVIEGASDIDLLVLHNGSLEKDREIVKLSNEYHLDILYEDARLYAQPRELRSDGWRGWAMWDPQLLYQKGRFFEYTQSVVRAQFEEPLNIIKRARFFAYPARSAWTEMQLEPENTSPLKILTAVFNAANALASLGGEPIPERRLMAEFPKRANNLDQSDLIQAVFFCISKSFSLEKARQWLPSWERAFLSASRSPADQRLHAARLSYYKNAIESQLDSDMPRAALWPILHTWAMAAENGTFDESLSEEWKTVCTEMGLDQEGCPARLQALDAYLDRMEEIFDQIMTDNGL